MSESRLEAFERFYSEHYGSRWPSLRAALERPERQIFRLNAFAEGASTSGNFEGVGEWLPESGGRSPARAANELLDGYVMDPASWWAAKALEVQEGDDVLDLCAAPGGKSLILAESLREAGTLVANEMSESRRDRLMGVIRQYLPRDLRERVRVSGRDGSLWGVREPEAFDRVLVDAPCSGERHLLASPKDLAAWSVRRSEGLATRQYALLCSAALAARPGGRIVYSTCALSPLENEGVVRKLIKKKSDLVRAVQIAPPSGAELVEGGVQFFPDTSGMGPIFYAVFERL